MSDFTGTAELVRLAVRRDRVALLVGILLLGGLAGSSAAATVALYPDAASRESAAAAANASGALVALYGPAHPAIGALAGLKMLASGAVFVALFAMFLVRRHTRADEESGRLELLSSGVVGRRAPLAAAVVVAVAAVTATAALGAAGFAASGLQLAGSVAFGAAWLIAGVTFTAISALAMQVSQSARTCAGLVGIALGVSYLLRAVGDVAGDGVLGALSWLSPLGWVQAIRPFAGERWWVLGLALVFSALVTAAAFALRDRRDLGAGLLPDRPGPEHTSMGSALALAWRLQRGTLLGLGLALLFAGALFGGLASNITALLDSPQAADMIRSLGGEGRLVDAFVAAEFGLLAVIVAGFGVAATLRLHSEETSTRSELALSTSTTRQSWLMSHVTMALAGTAAVLLLLGLGSAISQGLGLGDLGEAFRTVLPAALVQIPAVWVVIGVAVALYGVSSRLAVGAWVVLAACLLLGQFADLLRLPDWVSQISPFSHVPLLPGATATATPLVALVAVAGVAVLVGSLGFRRRDIG